MQTANAIRKLEGLGFYVHHNGTRHTAKTGGWEISVADQDGEVISIKVRRQSEKVDLTTDYFPGSYFKNLSQALRFLDRALAEG